MKKYNQSQLQDANQNVLFSCVKALIHGLTTANNFLNQLSIEYNRLTLSPCVDHIVELYGLDPMENSIKLSQKAQRMRLVICN